MRTSSCVTILFVVVLLCVGAQAQLDWFGFSVSQPMTIFGAFSDLPPQVVGLNNPFVNDADPTGRTHIPVTIQPIISRPFVTISPSPIVLNDANNFQALITITPTSIPSNWSDAGVIIAWTVSPNPNYTEPPNITLQLVPNTIEICVEDSNCFAPGPNGTVPALLIGYPSRPITVRSRVPPPGDVQISLSANGTTLRGDPTPAPALVFSTNPIVLTPSQPWATFTMASTVFPNQGYVVMNILSQSAGGPVYLPLPALPADSTSFTFTTKQIPSTIPAFDGSNPLNVTVGVPMLIAIHLEYPLPANNASIIAFSQGDALSISGPANFQAGSTIAFINVTAMKYSDDQLNIFFKTSPSDVNGPILPPKNLTLVTMKRTLVTNSPATTAADPFRVYLGEPFPLSFELPFTTPNFVEFSVSGPVNANGAVFSFDKNIVRLDNTNTNAVIFVTPTVWASATETVSETGDSFNAVVVLSLLRTANSDWALYDEPGDIEFTVSRRPFFVTPSQADQGATTIRLRYGQVSRPILISAPWAPTLKNLAADVVLTPYANAERGYAVFNPPFLTWNKASPQSQNITVTVLPQSDLVNIPTNFTVSWILSGAATDIQWFARTPVIANFPTFTVGEPTFHFWTPGSLAARTPGGALTALSLLAGETVTVLVAPEEYPPTGVTLTIYCPDTAITVPNATPINANTASITFGPTGPLNAMFQITAQSANPVGRSMDFELSGPDAAFYGEPAPMAVTVNARVVTASAITTTVTLGNQTDRTYFWLQDLPLNDLTVTLVPTSNAAAAAFTFTPATMSFGPATPYSRSFVAQANALGTYAYNVQLGGTDAAWYTPSQSQVTFTGVLRDSPAIVMTSNPNLIPGLLQGPYVINLNDAPDQDLTVTPRAGDWTFTPPAVAFAAGQRQALFWATYSPEFINTHVEDAKTEIFFTMSGTDSWKYVVPGSIVFTSNNGDIQKRRLNFDFTTGEDRTFVVGVPTAVRAFLDGPAPADITFGMKSAGFTLPDSVTIPAGQLSAWFTVVATAAPTQFFNQKEAIGASAVRVFFSVQNTAAAPLFDVPASQDWSVTLRTFLYDVMQDSGEFYNLQNTVAGFTQNNQVLVAGKASTVFSITAQVAPTTSVTLTPTNPYLSFSPAALTFSAGVLTVPFTVTPTSVPHRGRPQQIDWLLSGPDALAYSTAGLPDGTSLYIVPQLNFTFPTAIFIDGQADVTVNVLGNVPEGFTLHITAGTGNSFGVAIEPSALNFGGSGAPGPAPTTAAPANGTNTTTAAATTAAPQPAGAGRKFTIKHLRPAVVPFPTYPLTYTVKYAGYDSDDITLPVGTVPLFASVVTVLRYGIVPDFPFTLGYRNCKASINITRPPLSTLLITPSSPIESAVDNNGFRTDGNKDPAGRVIFTPPILVFPPGQRVCNFLARIDRRLDDDALYYRIDYKVDGIADDTRAYLPFLSTWHIGAASAQQVLMALAVALPLALALLM